MANDPSGKKLKELDWLIRSHAITVLPSVASLKILRAGSQTSSARKPMIAFADPVFSKAARAQAQQLAMRSLTSFYRGTQADLASIGEYLPQLPGTRRETQQIASELRADPADVRLGLSATETAVKQAQLDQYRIVYFATHGLVAGDLELFAKSKAEPALALSMPEQPDDLDDGLLTASEIAQLKLEPIGQSYLRAIPRRKTNPVRKRFRASPGRSSMPERDRSSSRIGASVTRQPQG